MKKIYLFLILLSVLLTGCTGCSKSGKINRHGGDNYASEADDAGSVSNIIKMKSENGIYKIPIEINGSNMNFIFDTGASDITISDVEALFLYKQGKLLKEDILGKEQYQIADGSISEGTIINLRTVRIGQKTLINVKASIVHNMDAPLLLGQSALAQFGKVSIDYDKNEITFE